MHPNQAFRRVGDAGNRAAALERGFGVLSVADRADAAPLAAHVPFVASDDGDAVEAHLVRSNPIARALSEGPKAALLVASGPDGYVSPDWYGLDADQVPTWNYVAQHLRGRLVLAPTESLRDHLDRLSARFEGELAPKPPWSTAKMTEAGFAKLARQIVPVRFDVETIEGTWKLNQNKPGDARRRAAAEIEGGHGHALSDLAALMRGLDDD